MMMPATYIDGIAASALAIADRILRWLTGADIRGRESSIRKVKSRISAIQRDNNVITRRIGLARKEMEYKRRGALIRYYYWRRDLLEAVVDDIKLLQDARFGDIKALKEAVVRKNGYRQLPTHAIKEFRALLNLQHSYIGEVKLFRNKALDLRQETKEIIRNLHDPSTHARLGAKKAIKAYLDNRINSLSLLYGSEISDGMFISIGDGRLELDVRCENKACSTWLASEMSHCFVCGRPQQSGLSLNPPVSLDYGIPCATCGMPLDEDCIYCFNCGNKHDPFGLVAVYKC